MNGGDAADTIRPVKRIETNKFIIKDWGGKNTTE
jgi:hypothetical protein